MEQYNKLSSEMYKHLVQQTVQQKKQKKVQTKSRSLSVISLNIQLRM